MEGNPIKYRDLIEPDDSIEKAIRQLNELSDAFSYLFNIVQRDAKKALDELKNVNENTEEGRQKAQALANASDKLAQAYRDLTIAETATGEKIVELKEEAKELNKVHKDTTQLANSVAGSYKALEAQYSKNRRELNMMSKAERTNTAEGKKLTKETRKLKQEMDKMDASIGKTSGGLRGMASSLNALPESSGGAVNSLRILGKQLWAIATNPVVLIILAVVGALKLMHTALTNTIDGQEQFNKVLAIGQGFLNTLLSLLGTLAVALIKQVLPRLQTFFKRLELWFETAKAGVISLQIVWYDLIRNRDKANEMRDKLTEVRQEIDITKDQLGELKDRQKEAAKEWQQDWQKVRDQFNSFGDDVKKNVKSLQDASEQRAAFMRAELKIREQNAKTQIEVDELHAESEKYRRADALKGLEFLRASYDLRTKMAKNEVYLAELSLKAVRSEASSYEEKYDYQMAELEATEALWAAKAKLGAVNRERFRQSNRFHTQAIAQAKARTASARRMYEAEAGARRRADEKILNEFTFDLKAREEAAKRLMQTQKDLAKRKYADQFSDIFIQVDFEEDAGTLSQADFHTRKLELYEILLDKELEAETQYLETIQGLRGEDSEKRIELEQIVLDTKIEYLDLELGLEQMQIERLRVSEATKTRMLLELEKKKAVERLEAMKKHIGAANEVEMKLLEEQIRLLGYQIEKARKEESLWDVMGLSMDDDTREGISSAFNYALDQMQKFLDAKISMADQAVKAAEKEMSATQKALDYELQARANGYASNVEQARKEMKLAEKQRRHAIQEKEKLQKAQERIQTAEQVTSLITASALIWSQLGNPLLAIPAIAVMWSSFAAAKVQAAKAAGGTEQYGEGHVELLRGGSHASGNDIDLGVKPDGTRRRAEGGEYFAVINKRSSRRFGSQIPGLINSLNDGSFPDKYANVFAGGGNLQLIQNENRIDLDRIEGDLRDIRDSNSRKRYTDSSGVVVEEYKNLKRVIR